MLNLNTVECIFCKQKFEIEGELRVTQLIECSHCHRLMEVVWLFPLELASDPNSEKSVVLKAQKDA